MNHIQSPRTCDTGIEQQIQAKGLTAPRVTPADIEANIRSEVYFTAADGMRTQQAHIKSEYVEGEHILAPLDQLTFCVLVLRNGFTVTGESACASPENFDAEIGRNIARQNAVQKIWPLMGYELRSKLAAS
ncbi:Gp49 family protein [Bordetella avium]|uniref:Gp49 family protein n=1 Tax=Bordetella avium TaxID=521 RepID=UPI00069042F5|nr:Gp49 family protein [Bordetella avium]